eukprot:CAMPEP_0173180866 /NCGR_PEP_ID=MMETSP1141-20130122/6960_1 /TAXON_ID=483371 /ORGANISM="non described non described, Strain CCMP2298" /LENGTH=63 /DNA_ID=CAMNT_0014103777 /DNA_START=317 /DNA_END=508 /DNA_ORIENTATION=-
MEVFVIIIPVERSRAQVCLSQEADSAPAVAPHLPHHWVVEPHAALGDAQGGRGSVEDEALETV